MPHRPAVRRLSSVVVLLALLAATPAARAQPMGAELLLDDSTDVRYVIAAREHTLGLRLDSAEAVLRDLSRRPGGLAASLHYRAQLSVLRGFLTDDRIHFTRFNQRADSLRRVLRSQPPTRWRYYFEGESEMQRAIVHGREERLARAGLSAKAAYDAYDRATGGGVVFPDAEKGKGLIQLVIGSAPGAYRWVLRLLGYSGSVEGGRRRLVLAATESRHNREDAALMLGVLDLIVRGDPESGLARFEGLYRADSSRVLVAHLYGFALLSDRRAADAARVLGAAEAAQSAPGTARLWFTTYYLGDARYKLGQYDEAIRLLRAYTENHRGPSLKAGAYLRLATALELTGRRADALAVYRQITHTRISETEEAAVRVAARRIAAPMSPADRALVLAENAYECGRNAEAAAAFEALITDLSGSGPAVVAAAHLRAARAYQALGSLADARRHAEAAVAAPGPDALAGWQPWGNYHAGEIAEKEGRRGDARRHYEAALRASGDFDYHLTLEQNAKTALERVR